MLTFFRLLSVHGGKGLRCTANEDTPPEKGTCQRCCVKSACPPQQPAAAQTTAQTSVWSHCQKPKITRQRAVLSLGTLLLLVFSSFLLSNLNSSLSAEKSWLMHGLFVVDEAFYIQYVECTQKDNVQTSWAGENLNVKTAVTWGEARMCKTRWLKDAQIVSADEKELFYRFLCCSLDFLSFNSFFFFPSVWIES